MDSDNCSFFGMFSGNALSPILASGILKLKGERGLKGWEWLFLSASIVFLFSFYFQRSEIDFRQSKVSSLSSSAYHYFSSSLALPTLPSRS